MIIAVVGVGRWGRNHVRVLKQLEGEGRVDEVVVCDVRRDAARAVAREYGVERYYGSVGEMLSECKPDGAVVAVPTLYHYKVAAELLPEADLLIEKPVAATLEEAAELVELAEAHGRKVLVGHIERFNQGLISLKEELAEMARGGDEVVYLSAQRVGPGPARGRSLNLGVGHDLMVHDVDVASFLLESFTKSVFAVVKHSPEFEHEVEVDALYTFDNGAETVASIRASYVARPTFKKRSLLIQTREASISFDYILQTYTIERGATEHRAMRDFVDILAAYRAEDVRIRRLLFRRDSEPLLVEDRHFVDVVEGRGQPFVSLVDGYIALKNVLMALKSASKRVELEIEWDEPFIDPESYYEGRRGGGP